MTCSYLLACLLAKIKNIQMPMIRPSYYANKPFLIQMAAMIQLLWKSSLNAAIFISILANKIRQLRDLLKTQATFTLELVTRVKLNLDPTQIQVTSKGEWLNLDLTQVERSYNFKSLPGLMQTRIQLWLATPI